MRTSVKLFIWKSTECTFLSFFVKKACFVRDLQIKQEAEHTQSKLCTPQKLTLKSIRGESDGHP